MLLSKTFELMSHYYYLFHVYFLAFFGPLVKKRSKRIRKNWTCQKAIHILLHHKVMPKHQSENDISIRCQSKRYETTRNGECSHFLSSVILFFLICSSEFLMAPSRLMRETALLLYPCQWFWQPFTEPHVTNLLSIILRICCSKVFTWILCDYALHIADVLRQTTIKLKMSNLITFFKLYRD